MMFRINSFKDDFFYCNSTHFLIKKIIVQPISQSQPLYPVEIIELEEYYFNIMMKYILPPYTLLVFNVEINDYAEVGT